MLINNHKYHSKVHWIARAGFDIYNFFFVILFGESMVRREIIIMVSIIRCVSFFLFAVMKRVWTSHKNVKCMTFANTNQCWSIVADWILMIYFYLFFFSFILTPYLKPAFVGVFASPSGQCLFACVWIGWHKNISHEIHTKSKTKVRFSFNVFVKWIFCNYFYYLTMIAYVIVSGKKYVVIRERY